jgi:hypothetical protein
MNAREVEAAAHDLARSKARIREAICLAAGCAVVPVILSPVALAAALAFGAGVATAALVATAIALGRQDRIAKLALDPAAHELPEVSRFATRLTGSLDRERLASWLREMLRDASCLPETWCLSNRVMRYADELLALSHELADPGVQIRPVSAAACHLLLTQMIESPLYNPAVPAEQLPAIIANIRLGMSRLEPSGTLEP